MKSLFIISLLISAVQSNAQFDKYRFQQPKMGSPFNIILYSKDSLAAASAASQAFRFIDTLNSIYSHYLATSELNRLCLAAGNQQWIAISEPLFYILAKAAHAARASNGYFDVTVGPLSNVWKQARRSAQLPAPAALQEAKTKVGYNYLQLDSTHSRARLMLPGMQIDLSGIAKGETAQRTVQYLARIGFPYCLVDAGGDIVAGDMPAGKEGWKIAINLPRTERVMDAQLLLRNMAVTTSGDLYQYVEIDGKRYSHIINPKTGKAVAQSRNVTVIAPQGCNADWLTKACSILPIQKAIRLVERYDRAAVQIAIIKKGEIHFYRSKNFESYFEKSGR